MMDHPTPSTRETFAQPDEAARAHTAPAPALAISLRTSRTPYSPRVEAQGVRSYTVYNHILLPAIFRSLAEDYRHLKQNVQLWDVSCEQQVEIRGPDAARLTQLMTPRDLSKATIGQCLYAPLIDEAGGMINDPVILKLTEDRYWISISDSDVLLWAKGLAIGFGLDVAVERGQVDRAGDDHQDAQRAPDRQGLGRLRNLAVAHDGQLLAQGQKALTIVQQLPGQGHPCLIFDA